MKQNGWYNYTLQFSRGSCEKTSSGSCGFHSYYIKGRDVKAMEVPTQASWIIRKIFAAREWMQPISHTMQNPNKLSIKAVYGATASSVSKGAVKTMVLLKGLVSRHQFILWLALQNKLNTVDRLLKWGIQVSTECVLCETQVMQTHDHLFFGCIYSCKIWQTLLGRIWQRGWKLECGRLVGRWKMWRIWSPECYFGNPVCSNCLCYLAGEKQQEIQLKEAKPLSEIVCCWCIYWVETNVNGQTAWVV